MLQTRRFFCRPLLFNKTILNVPTKILQKHQFYSSAAKNGSEKFRSSTKMLTNELLRLDEIGNSRAWNYEKPTLVKEGRNSNWLPFKAGSLSKAASFRYKFYDKFSALRHLKMDNIVFKGGCILDILLDNDPKELDLFLVGLNSNEAALERAKELLNNFLTIEEACVRCELWQNQMERYETWEQSLEGIEPGFDFDEMVSSCEFDPSQMAITAIRTGFVIWLRLSALPIPVKIVLLRYDNVAHCLRDDDLGATAIAFDGQEVWLNAESKFAIENLTIRVDPRNLTGAASNRLAKYFHKGFDLVLPELDMAKLPRRDQKLGLADTAALPGLVFGYNKIEGNKIFVHEFVDKEEEKKKKGCDDSYHISGRLFMDLPDIDYVPTVLKIRAENIKKFCNDATDFVQLAHDDRLLSVLQVWPGITLEQIADFYNSFKCELVHESKFDFGIAKKYFVLYPVAQIANKLFTAENMDKALDTLTDEHIKRAKEKLIKKFAEAPERELVKIRRKEWDDCEAFPRIYKQNAEFYGEFHNNKTAK